MSFLTGLMNLQEAVANTPIPKPPRKQKPKPKVEGPTRAERCADAYAELFATPTTVGEASGKRNISYVGCLNQVYRYEKRGLLQRVGTQDTFGRAILWQWIGKKP